MPDIRAHKPGHNGPRSEFLRGNEPQKKEACPRTGENDELQEQSAAAKKAVYEALAYPADPVQTDKAIEQCTALTEMQDGDDKQKIEGVIARLEVLKAEQTRYKGPFEDGALYIDTLEELSVELEALEKREALRKQFCDASTALEETKEDPTDATRGNEAKEQFRRLALMLGGGKKAYRSMGNGTAPTE